jgi:lysophospholipase L1-like esterase
MEKIINIFGSSIAWGACDNEKGGWVNRLRNYLADREENYCEVYNLGVSGDNSENLLKRFSIENEARTPNIIMIGIGLNDSQYIHSKNNPRVSLEKFESNLLELIKQAKKFTEEIIFVGLTKVDEKKLMPTPWDNTKYYDEENVALYDAKIKEICEKNNLPFIPMLDLLSDEDLSADGLHPNSQGHKKMFLRVKDFLITSKII